MYLTKIQYNTASANNKAEANSKKSVANYNLRVNYW